MSQDLKILSLPVMFIRKVSEMEELTEYCRS